jgi:hypothetical protein
MLLIFHCDSLSQLFLMINSMRIFYILTLNVAIVSCSADFTPWRWGWYVPLKLWLTYRLYDIIFQKMATFITTTVRHSNATYLTLICKFYGFLFPWSPMAFFGALTFSVRVLSWGLGLLDVPVWVSAWMFAAAQLLCAFGSLWAAPSCINLLLGTSDSLMFAYPWSLGFCRCAGVHVCMCACVHVC